MQLLGHDFCSSVSPEGDKFLSVQGPTMWLRSICQI